MSLTIFGDGAQSRAFSYIRDMSPIMAEAIDVPSARNQVFNIGADQNYTVRELAERIAASMGVAPDILHVPARNEVQHAYSDHAKVRRVFGDRPLHTLDEGLARMAEWARRHGARQSSPFENIEVLKNLPKAWLNG